MSGIRFALQQRRIVARKNAIRGALPSRDGFLYDALKWRRGTILIWTVGSVGVAVVALSMVQPSFTATAEITAPFSGSVADDASFSSNAAYLATLAEAVRSDDVIRSVANDMHLWNIPEFSNPSSERLASIFRVNRVSAEGSSATERETRTVAAIKNALSISRESPNQAVRITVRSRDPKTAADVANAVAQTSARSFAEKRDEDENQAINDLEQRLNRLSAQTDAAKKTADELRDAHNGGDIEKRRKLQAELKTYQALHATVLQQYAEAVKPKTAISSHPRVITKAIPDPSSNADRAMLTLLLAACGGGLLGTAFGARREFRDRPIRSGDAVEHALGFPFLGAIAAVPGRQLVPAAPQLPPLILRDDQDILRKALANIREVMLEGGSYVIGVSSAKAAEGKSTIAFNMAVVASEGRERVLLIDADLHQPRLMHEIGMPSSPSLNDILRGQTRPTAQANKSEYGFEFVGAHEPDSTMHPTSVLGSTAMATFLADARSQYDVIICDLPDISNHADPIVFASSLDVVVLVAEWGTSATTLARAARQSQAISARIHGVLVNKAPSGVVDFA
jgi:Mrp family chromosome partitioning ATPase